MFNKKRKVSDVSKTIDMGQQNKDNHDEVKWRPYTLKVATVIAVLFSLFHLVYGYFSGTLETLELRSLHLGFILVLTLLLYPAKKKWMYNKLTFTMDILLIMGAAASCIYLYLLVPTLAKHVGSATVLDKVFAVIIVVALFETTRRVIGWVVPSLALVFLIYNFFGPYFPGLLQHRGFSFSRVVSHMYLTSEGIFTTPLGACADYIVLFTVFGALLDASGGSEFFTDLAMSICGRFRGGPAKVAIVASALFGTISGSAAANVLVTGQITIPLMKSSGYKSKYAGAVEACASSGGQLMPPVMGASAFIMADILGVSYLAVCAAALVPAILYYYSLFIAVDVEAARANIGGIASENLPKMKDVLRKGGHFIVPFVVLIVSLAVLKYSVQKSILFGIIALLVVMQMRKSSRVSRRTMIIALRNGGFQAIQVALACATAGIIIGTFSLTGLGLKLSSLLIAISGGNLMALLILTMISSLILGMGMPTTAAYVILAILVAPALINLGVLPLAAHLFVLYFGVISAITPPVALAAFTAATLTGDNPMQIGLEACRLGVVAFIVPFMFIYNPTIILKGDIAFIIISIIQTVLGVMAVVYGISGYIYKKMSILKRILLSVGGVSL